MFLFGLSKVRINEALRVPLIYLSLIIDKTRLIIDIQRLIIENKFKKKIEIKLLKE